jgi:aminoglycoside phosphotransferase family enzyme/predicted kinase
MKSQQLPSLIQQMLEPTFYPHLVKEPIQLIQTHASFVFLTGSFVYKLKKPVNFGFLDYSTLEKRHHFCQEEFRMNQRTAPDIYLEVLPISQINNKFQLADATSPVEYTLKMRQFPENALFIEMFEQGKLTEKHLENLGHIVANFHAHCPSNDYIRSFGDTEQIGEAINQNYEQSQKYIDGPQTQQQFDETKQYTDNLLNQHQDLFKVRVQQDKIRECHGDLHLKNIALVNDQIILFDCIEFNESFRFVDVMYDVAFTVMDLDARQRPDFSNVFLNTYLEQTGDWEGGQVLPFYLSRQAYVRAKVTSLLLDDPNVPQAEKEKAFESAKNYYELAWKYTQNQQGQLILMSGLSGSGKSTVAKKLARQINAIHIRSDAVRKHLAGIPLSQRGGDEIYTPEMTQKTYTRLLELGIKLANLGWTVILDAKYDRQVLRQPALEQAKTHQLPVKILYCDAPIKILRERLNQRIGDIADATADLLASQQNAAEPFSKAEQPNVIVLDTTQNLEEQLKALVFP